MKSGEAGKGSAAEDEVRPSSSIDSKTPAPKKDDEAKGDYAKDVSASSSKTPPKPDSEQAGDGKNLLDKFVSELQKALPQLGTSKDKKSQPPAVLASLDLAGVAAFIKSGRCENIVVMTGAGISTAAGIPDFRSPGTGLYDNLAKYELPHPQAIFEIGFFRKNPQPFFTLAKELFPGNFKPTASHYFLKLLAQKGLLLRSFTQNIDTLEHVAEIPAEFLVEAHGSFHQGHCLKCRSAYTLPWMKEEIFADKIPACTKPKCDGVVKPDIVFFGENLPRKFFHCMKEDMPMADLLIVMGTSLVVQPFASLTDEVGESCPRLLLNDKPVGKRSGTERALGMPGLDYAWEGNHRDVFWQGTCDDGVRELAALCGWAEELDKLIQDGHAKL